MSKLRLNLKKENMVQLLSIILLEKRVSKKYTHYRKKWTPKVQGAKRVAVGSVLSLTVKIAKK